jgi:glutaredoxin
MAPSRSVLFVAPLLGLAACHHPPSLTPQQIDDDWRACQQSIGDGSYDMTKRSPKRVGVGPQRKPPGTPVIMYGASWCDACKVAAQYMSQRGIPFVERDVEKEPGAADDARAALAAASLERDGALPVLDVRGTVIMGFFSCALQQAWVAP